MPQCIFHNDYFFFDEMSFSFWSSDHTTIPKFLLSVPTLMISYHPNSNSLDLSLQGILVAILFLLFSLSLWRRLTITNKSVHYLLVFLSHMSCPLD